MSHEGLWFREEICDGIVQSIAVRNVLFRGKTKFQDVQILDLETLGKTLFMDGKMQSSQIDEFIYHEALVHPTLLLHPNPKSVFIGGGGEFATVREVLRHKTVERLVMVDIDEESCMMCKKHLPEWGAGTYDDPRLSTHFEDASGWLQNSGQKFDVIIMDICDPQDGGPGMLLYYQSFYAMVVAKCLNPGGIFITQSGAGNIATDSFTVIHSTLRTVFKHVVPYVHSVVSFGSDWAWNIAFNDDAAAAIVGEGGAAAGDQAAVLNAVRDLSAGEFDKRVAERISGELQFLDGLTYRSLMGVPKYLRKRLAEEERVMTAETPVFLYDKFDH
jgi:thermospermine synthase